jgi:hypothetical protein
MLLHASSRHWYGAADQGGDGDVSNQKDMTWSDYLQILALSIVLAAIGNAVFYCVVQVLQ